MNETSATPTKKRFIAECGAIYFGEVNFNTRYIVDCAVSRDRLRFIADALNYYIEHENILEKYERF